MVALTQEKPLTPQALEEQFLTLPEDTARAYELALTELCKQPDTAVLRRCLQTLLDDEAGDHEVQYAAFYCLVILDRHNLNSTSLTLLFQEYRARFQDKRSLNHLFLTAALRHDDMDLFEYLEMAEESAKSLPDNAGYTHLFAELVARVAEETDDPVAREKVLEKWHGPAMEAVNRAIHGGGGYAKYYCTKGRLLALNKQFNAADTEILKAIDQESSDRSDYSIRIGQYQYYRIQVQADKKIDQIEQDSDKMKTNMDGQLAALKDSLMSNVEIIAFFAGIISFIIGSLTLASGHTAREACAMIMALLGCLLSAFSGLAALLHTGDLHRRLPGLAVVFFIGVAFLIGGIALV